MKPSTAPRDQLADAATAAAAVADSTIAALRVLVSEQAIRSIIEREAKVAVQAILLAQAGRAAERKVEPVPQPPRPLTVPSAERAKIETLALRINTVASHLGLSRSKIYSLIASGDLKARKLGVTTIILRADLEAFLQALPTTKDPK